MPSPAPASPSDACLRPDWEGWSSKALTPPHRVSGAAQFTSNSHCQAGCHVHVRSREARRAAQVGVGALPAHSGGLPPHSLLSNVAVSVPGKPVGGRESLTSLPVNNDFLLGPFWGESPGRAISSCWRRRKQWCERVLWQRGLSQLKEGLRTGFLPPAVRVKVVSKPCSLL